MSVSRIRSKAGNTFCGVGLSLRALVMAASHNYPEGVSAFTPKGLQPLIGRWFERSEQPPVAFFRCTLTPKGVTANRAATPFGVGGC